MKRSIYRRLALLLLPLLMTIVGVRATAAGIAKRCLSDCTPRFGIVSAFGAEADILIAQTSRRKTTMVNGYRFATGVLRGNRVVVVLSGVPIVNAAKSTQLLLEHFNIERLIMSGIAGGLNPELHVGDVTVPERWIMPMEAYWSHDSALLMPCGTPGDLSCMGLKLATDGTGKVLAPFDLPASTSGVGLPVATVLFMRESALLSRQTGLRGESVFSYPVAARMLAVARQLTPVLKRCADPTLAAPPITPPVCVGQQPACWWAAQA